MKTFTSDYKPVKKTVKFQFDSLFYLIYLYEDGSLLVIFLQDNNEDVQRFCLSFNEYIVHDLDVV